MCGIVGILAGRHDVAYHAILAAMAGSLRHRGPDDSGMWRDENAGVWLGHRRLSVIDLTDTGHQPMLSQSGRLVIVFNGEIYNFSELSHDLRNAGVTFRGRSDTEVLLEAIERWGVRTVLERSRGMFAFALWDRLERCLTLARDRFGEKPLYVASVAGDLLFASELRAIELHPAFTSTIRVQSVADYLGYGYVPAPATIFENAYKILPGTTISFDAGATARDYGDLKSSVRDAAPYWSLRRVADEGRSEGCSLSDAEAVDEADRLLKSAVKEQVIADVPVGAFLSGGIDSSLITALMQAQAAGPVRTFTIGFAEGDYDESKHANAVARHLGTDHTTLMVSPTEAMGAIPRLSNVYDEPFADSSQIPTLLVAELARSHVTVSLSGDGGDETFGGYNRHQFAPVVWERMRHWPRFMRRLLATSLEVPDLDFWTRTLRIAARSGLMGDQHRLPVEKLYKVADVLPAQDPQQVYDRLTYRNASVSLLRPHAAREAEASRRDEWPVGYDFAEAMMLRDSIGYLPDDILTKVDRAAMSVSLETRIPLLDPRVVAFAWRLPLRMKIRSRNGKWILKQVLRRYIPEALLRRDKSGFAVPIDDWLRGPLRGWAEELLMARGHAGSQLLNSSAVIRMWQDHLALRRNWHHELWSVLMFQAWLYREPTALESRERRAALG